jgi:2-dehydropantoate 2-reductase
MRVCVLGAGAIAAEIPVEHVIGAVVAQQIGDRIGCPIAQTPEDRSLVTRKLGAFTTSMLQDARAGRGLELDALVGAVREIGGLIGVPTPAVDALYGLTRLWARCHLQFASP